MDGGIDEFGSIAVPLHVSEVEEGTVRDRRIVSRVALGDELKLPKADDRRGGQALKFCGVRLRRRLFLAGLGAGNGELKRAL